MWLIFLVRLVNGHEQTTIILLSAVGLEPPQLSVSEERHLAILTELPFVVPFEERVKVRTALSRVLKHSTGDLQSRSLKKAGSFV